MKPYKHISIAKLPGSHPSRVRGLKLIYIDPETKPKESHPSRVRGLKPFIRRVIVGNELVAPLTGAWIETLKDMSSFLEQKSHPSRVRGLKHRKVMKQCRTDWSHPSRVRGLKLFTFIKPNQDTRSHPSRVRGLKLTDNASGVTFPSRTPHGCVD